MVSIVHILAESIMADDKLKIHTIAVYRVQTNASNGIDTCKGNPVAENIQSDNYIISGTSDKYI